MNDYEVLGRLLCADCGVDHQLYEVEIKNPPYTAYKQILCGNCIDQFDNEE